jgi:transcriptional regulator with XRE-family HTH domain
MTFAELARIMGLNLTVLGRATGRSTFAAWSWVHGRHRPNARTRRVRALVRGPGRPRGKWRRKVAWTPERIQALLDLRGWTKAELGRRAGVTPWAVYRWLAGRTSPHASSAAILGALERGERPLLGPDGCPGPQAVPPVFTAERVEALKRRLGATDRQIAAACRVLPTVVSAWRHGRIRPRAASAALLARLEQGEIPLPPRPPRKGRKKDG